MDWREHLDCVGRVIAVALASTLGVAIPHTHAVEPATQSPKAAEQIDLVDVHRKIAALAMPDDTVPFDERPVTWLHKRRERILSQLITALDDKNPKIAEHCLDILRDAPTNKELTDALIAKAGDETSPLRYETLRQLEKSAADPRVVRLLDQASTQAENFPDLLARARWAGLAGHKDRAVEILKPILTKLDDPRYENIEAIRLLGQIGTPASVALLQPIAAGDNWELAARAYSALAEADPIKHGLTNDQATLLKGWRGGKETSEDFRRRSDELAKLNAKEIRPFVMQMLRDKTYQAQYGALLILTAWKDKDALPQIRTLMQGERPYHRRPAVAAWLSIDDSPQAEKDVLLLLADNSIVNDGVLRGIVSAAIPADRKVAMLRAARNKPNMPRAVAEALRFAMYQAQDFGELLSPLMDTETNLQILAGYCKLATKDKQKRFSLQVRRAMELLSDEPTVSAGGEKTNDSTAIAGQFILEAVAAYDLNDLAPAVQKLMRSKNATIRTAAQAAGARLSVAEAMKDLYAQLDDKNAYVRKLAVQALMNIKPTGDTERTAREESVLSCLGKPSEDYAMRVLATCGGEKTIKALEPILDDPDARRAVYAAWVLAQLPDKAAAAKGIRRVAIFGMFHYQIYQQGAGIDFHIATDLDFHQVTEEPYSVRRKNSARTEPRTNSSRVGPVRIPDNLLMPFVLDDAEQQYAVRCYQLAEAAGNVDGLDVDFLRYRWQFGPKSQFVINRTYLPLLKEIASHDSHISRLMVKGQPVAHLEYRQLAAKETAAITKNKAAYVGLAGETLDSDVFPEPYKNQNQLLAKFVVDQVQKARLPGNPQNDQQWRRFEFYRARIRQLEEKFGPQVLDAIRREAEQRDLDVKKLLPIKQS